MSTHSSPQFVCIFLLILSICTIYGCSNTHDERLDEASALMEERPDSALTILKTIKPESLNNEYDHALYALLSAVAYDKLDYDTTNVDILNPAVEYFLNKGNPDEKLRTYYYLGRIYQNGENDQQAMRNFIKAEYVDNIRDSLTYARLLVAEGSLYDKCFNYYEHINNNLKASHIYKRLGRHKNEILALTRAYHGSIVDENQMLADSLHNEYLNLIRQYPEYADLGVQTEMVYQTTYGSDNELSYLLQKVTESDSIDDDLILDIASGYQELGQLDKAMEYLNIADSCHKVDRSLKHLATRADILEATGNYKEAVNAFREYLHYSENQLYHTLKNGILFEKQRHEMTKNSFEEIRNRDIKILWWIGCTIILIVLCGVLYSNYRINKIKAASIQKENEKLNDRRISLQKSNEELQREKDMTVRELDDKNIKLHEFASKILDLETESRNLKKIIDERNDINADIRDAIKTRLDILNSILAYRLSPNTANKPINEILNDNILNDREGFMNSTRLSFKISHPQFISELEERGLTETEINYVCLFAIGLNGKEIGEFTKSKRHYHLSSDIRKKLGIATNSTNLANYIRQMRDNANSSD